MLFSLFSLNSLLSLHSLYSLLLGIVFDTYDCVGGVFSLVCWVSFSIPVRVVWREGCISRWLLVRLEKLGSLANAILPILIKFPTLPTALYCRVSFSIPIRVGGVISLNKCELLPIFYHLLYFAPHTNTNILLFNNNFLTILIFTD